MFATAKERLACFFAFCSDSIHLFSLALGVWGIAHLLVLSREWRPSHTHNSFTPHPSLPFFLMQFDFLFAAISLSLSCMHTLTKKTQSCSQAAHKRPIARSALYLDVFVSCTSELFCCPSLTPSIGLPSYHHSLLEPGFGKCCLQTHAHSAVQRHKKTSTKLRRSCKAFEAQRLVEELNILQTFRPLETSAQQDQHQI